MITLSPSSTVWWTVCIYYEDFTFLHSKWRHTSSPDGPAWNEGQYLTEIDVDHLVFLIYFGFYQTVVRGDMEGMWSCSQTKVYVFFASHWSWPKTRSHHSVCGQERRFPTHYTDMWESANCHCTKYPRLWRCCHPHISNYDPIWTGSQH